MAINFPASIAAYIAAGLNVPRRQFMYCISQETGQPYVLHNKDGMERMHVYGQPGSNYGGQDQPPNGYNLVTQSQSQQSSTTPNQQPLAQNPSRPESRGIPIASTEKNSSTHSESQSGPSKSSLTSPVASPYPSADCSVSGADDEQMASQQTSTNSPDTHTSDGSDRNPHCDMTYYSRGHVLSPGSFMSYLKQPGVMLTPLNPAEASGDFPNMPAELLNQGMVTGGLGKTNTRATNTSSGGGGGGNSNGDPSRMFKCLECGKEFRQKSTLLQHERIHTNSRPFACVDCDKRFRQQSHLVQHLRIHANEKPFACLYCDRTFRQRAILNQHMRIHSGEKPYVCVECGKGFRQKAILNQHVRTHQTDSISPTCPTTHFLTDVIGGDDVDEGNEEVPGGCSSSSSNEGLNLARRDEKTDAALSTTLTISNKDAGSHLIYKNGQLWPQEVYVEQKSSNYNNDNNTTTTNNNSNNNNDQACCSPESAPQFPYFFKESKDNITPRIFGNPSRSLPEVIQQRRAAAMPLYVRCPICQEEFKQKSTLLQHGCVHIESRPYPCVECGKRFRQQSHLTQHLRIHTNQKPFACLYCRRTFRQRTILDQHLRIHTGEKPYKCAQCGKDFRQKAILDQHTRTHQGARPFCCPMPGCKRRFCTEQEVKRHLDNHMNPNSSKKRMTLESKMRPLGPGVMLNSNATMVKPELYFPQCYFNNQQQYTSPRGGPSSQGPPQNHNGSDFKGSQGSLPVDALQPQVMMAHGINFKSSSPILFPTIAVIQ